MSETSNTCYVCGHPITYEEKRTAFVDSHSTEACIPYLMADKDEAEARAAALQAELDSVDWILSGRPALAEKGTRREKIEYALHTAGKADAALARAAAAEEREKAALRERDEARVEAARWRSELSAACELSERARQIVQDALNQPPEYHYDHNDNGQWGAEHAAHAIRILFEQRDKARKDAEDLERECIRLEDKLARGSWDALVMLNPDGTCKVCGPDCKVTR